jgi:hypothetical protein
MQLPKYKSSKLLLLCSFIMNSCNPFYSDSSSTERTWNSANRPVALGGRSDLERRLSKLPDEGKVKSNRRPWHSTFWPSRLGGISTRWNSPNIIGFWSQPPRLEQLNRMSLQEKAMLSPSEKYDVFMGNYTYPLTQYEKSRTHPLDQDWEGLGHGVAAASLVFPEPKAVVVQNPFGIEVPFGSADIKGLLALYMGYVAKNDLYFVGQRCNRPLAVNSNSNDVLVNLGQGQGRESLFACEDINAGSFHILLTNWLGKQRESIIADVAQGVQVWNQPILEYSSRVVGTQAPSKLAAQETVRETIMETTVFYAANSKPAWRDKEGLVEESIEKQTYRYTLELNRDGDILGGEWLVKNYPDFIWKQNKPSFDFYFHRLGYLLEKSAESQWNQDLSYRF